MELTTADRYYACFPDDASGAGQPSSLAQLNMRIKSVSASACKYLESRGRFILSTERTEQFTPDLDGTKKIRVMGYPITEVDSIAFNEEAFDPVDDYFVLNQFGTIAFTEKYYPCQSVPNNTIAVVYTGGMAADTASFVAAYPDIESAVLMQINFELTRYKTISNKTISNGASSSTMNPYGLLDEVTRVLNSYCPMPES